MRQVLQQRFDLALLLAAVAMFVKLQRTSSQYRTPLIELGVPDWRFERWPALIAEMLTDQDTLTAAGISSTEIKELATRIPVIAARCQLLAKTPIPYTLVQPDFHDNNVLVDRASGRLTLIDVGEIVISHPFLSLANALQQFKHHHAITEQDPTYASLLNAMLEPFLPYATTEQLDTVMVEANNLNRVYSVLAQYRLIQCCGYQSVSRYQPTKFAHSLRALLCEGL